MRISTVFLALFSTTAFAVAVPATECNPVLLLPGMRPADRARSAHSVVSKLPQPVISDLRNAPNPFDSRKAGLEGQTEISYTLAGDFPVTLTLYDLTGYKVRAWSFRPGEMGGRMGPNALRWDGTNAAGNKTSKGGYLATVAVDTPVTIATALRKIAVIH